MRTHLLYLFLVITAFSACKKEDDPVFDQSPDKRINETLNKYQKELTGAPYGWKGLVFPAGVPKGVFWFYFKFNDANRVTMFSDFDATSSVTLKESSYRLKALQQPSLLFDTYSYLHVLSDPDANVNGGIYGKGLYSDFEFSLDGISGDTILLTGRFNKSKAMLIKATQQEAKDYNEGKRNRLFENIASYLYYFKRITIGAKQYEVTVNLYAHVIGFTWIDSNGVVHRFTTGFYYTPNGIAFAPAFTDGGQTITGLENMTWSAESETLRFSVNNTNATITGFAKPVAVDSTAGKRWWDQVPKGGAGYWISYNGFHVDGVEDAHDVNSLPNYVALVYYPGYAAGYDWLRIFQNNYGPAFGPTFNPNGIVTFTSPGNFGTVPANVSPTVAKIRSKFTESTGFYFVQTNAISYDMVSAKDGKTWINWYAQ